MTSQETTSAPHVSLDSKHYKLCPNIDDLSTIEKKLSTSLLDLAKKLSNGVISLEEQVVILEHSIEAEARHLNIKELMLQSGITHITQAITSLFSHIFGGHGQCDIPRQGISKDTLDQMTKKFPD